VTSCNVKVQGSGGTWLERKFTGIHPEMGIKNSLQ
jgi:hypothetical protein